MKVGRTVQAEEIACTKAQRYEKISVNLENNMRSVLRAKIIGAGSVI